jgi:hypothetical protein
MEPLVCELADSESALLSEKTYLAAAVNEISG